MAWITEGEGYCSKCEELQKKLALAVTALEFYANRADWTVYESEPIDRPMDNGNKAREALTEIRKV